jgi:insulysin
MINKSKADDREYKRIVLDNMLEVVMVYDKNADESAASLSVAVGNYMDPLDALGLAHFLEHMLFMGTKKYPSTKHFMEFINKNGGSYNAHTGNEYTTYFYSITNDALAESLDIFGQFFINPLFDKTNVSKEMNAVNSEHSKNINNDMWRFFRIISEVANKNHPFSKFSTGTLETLGNDNIRDQLIEFFNKHYSSNVMKLVVSSNLQFDELEKHITEIFSQIKNNNYIPQKYDAKPFDFKIKKNEQKNVVAAKIIKLVPIVDTDELVVVWSLPPLKRYFKYKPVEFLSHLLGHEGTDTYIHKLKDEGLILSMNTMSLDSDISNNLLGIFFKLTDKGYHQIPYIIDELYKYVDLIKVQGLKKWIYDELKNMNKINFDNIIKSNPIDYVLNMSENLLYYPYENILDVNYINDQYSDDVVDLFKRLLMNFNKHNSLVIISSKKYESIAIKEEYYYKINYIDKLMPSKYGSEFTLHTTNDKKKVLDVRLPDSNKWIPGSDKLKLINQNIDQGIQKQKISNNINLWYKKDDTFDRPEIIISINIFSKYMISNIKNYCSLRLYIKIIFYLLKSELYYASLGNTDISLNINTELMGISITTYPDNVAKAIDLIIFALTKNSIPDDIFEINKNEVILDSSNYIYNTPISHAYEQLNKDIYNVYYDNKELLKCYKSISKNDLDNIFNKMTKECFLECFIMGNFNKSNISNFNEMVLKHFSKDHSLDVFRTNTTNKLTVEEKIFNNNVLNPNEPDSAIIFSYELGKIQSEPKELAKALMIQMLTKERFFNDLRSVQQSGYIVKSMYDIEGGVRDIMSTMVFYVQSSTRPIGDIQQSIKVFIKDTVKFIKNLKANIFNNFKNSLVKQLSKKYDNIYEEYEMYIGQIKNGKYNFDKKQQLIKELATLDKSSIMNFFEKHFINKSKRLRISIIHGKN